MYRLWGKIFKDNKCIEDCVFEMSLPKTTGKNLFFQGLEYIAYELDLQYPMWLSDNETDFNRFGKVRFYNDHFIEIINFDYLELEIIEQSPSSLIS